MTDPRLVKLEERWKQTGALEDETAYLAERLRLGAVVKGRVELAAFLDYPAAIAVVGRMERKLKAQGAPRLEHWAEALRGWGTNAAVRAAVAHTTAELHALRVEIQGGAAAGPGSETLGWVMGNVPVVIARLALLEEWLAGRDAQLKARILRIAWEFPEVGERPHELRRRQVAHAQGKIVDFGAPPAWESRCRNLLEITDDVSSAFQKDKTPRWWGDFAGRALMPLGEARAVCAPIRAELVPWALRYGDPVKARVAARRLAAGSDSREA